MKIALTGPLHQAEMAWLQSPCHVLSLRRAWLQWILKVQQLRAVCPLQAWQQGDPNRPLPRLPRGVNNSFLIVKNKVLSTVYIMSIPSCHTLSSFFQMLRKLLTAYLPCFFIYIIYSLNCIILEKNFQPQIFHQVQDVILASGELIV